MPVFRPLLMSLLLVFAVPATAQKQLTAQEIAALVDEANRLIKEKYVEPQKVDAMTGRLSEGLKKGRYSVSDPQQLAQLMTQDLLAASNDKHMGIKFDPDEAKARRSEGLNAQQQGPTPAFFKTMMDESNHGITELKILPGNVRYMNISGFLWDAERSPKVYDDAIRFLKGGAAYIIDLRGNGGGDGDAVTYLTSHFMSAGQKLMTFRAGPRIEQETFTKAVPEGKLAAPLFVLTSGKSASAAEEMAAHVKGFKLGKLVGAKTAGAGNSNDMYPVGEGFVLSVSARAAIQAALNSGWEGTGIAPDLQAPVPGALDLAHMEALKMLKPKADPKKQAQLQWTIDGLEAKINPKTLPREQLLAYTGSYGKDRKVTERTGKLYWHLGNQEWELVAFGDDLFGFASGPALRIKFTRNAGEVSGVAEVMQSGKEIPFPRSTT